MYGDMLFIAAKFKKREVLSSAGNFIKKKKKLVFSRNQCNINTRVLLNWMHFGIGCVRSGAERHSSPSLWSCLEC